MPTKLHSNWPLPFTTIRASVFHHHCYELAGFFPSCSIPKLEFAIVFATLWSFPVHLVNIASRHEDNHERRSVNAITHFLYEMSCHAFLVKPRLINSTFLQFILELYNAFVIVACRDCGRLYPNCVSKMRGTLHLLLFHANNRISLRKLSSFMWSSLYRSRLFLCHHSWHPCHPWHS